MAELEKKTEKQFKRGTKVTIQQFEGTISNPIHDDGKLVGYRITTGTGKQKFWAIVPLHAVKTEQPT